MEGYINENKWVDLSVLPIHANHGIDWENSINKIINFTYNDVISCLKILEFNKRNHTVRISVPNYTNKNGYWIETYELKRCNLGGVIRKNILLNAPHLIIYLEDKDDAFYSLGCNKYIFIICPDCGDKRKVRVSDLTKNGFSCRRCGDGISYPNKFMTNLLSQICSDFAVEISKNTPGYEWVGNYRYDFLLIRNNLKYLIEMDGGFHYHDIAIGSYSLEERRLIDSYKDKIAQENGHIVIRINCDYYRIDERYDIIKNNILNSQLYTILSLNEKNIDWNECDRAGCTSLCIKACNYWNNGINSTLQIANIMHINSETVRRYLKTGAKFGLCDYDPSLALQNAPINKMRPIKVFWDEINFYIFKNIDELIILSNQIFGRQFKRSSIYACCGGYQYTAYGYHMEYSTKIEYSQFNKRVFVNQLNKFSNLQGVI